MKSTAATVAPRAASAGAERAPKNASTVRPADLAPSSVRTADLPSATTPMPVHRNHKKAANTESLKTRLTTSPAKATQAVAERGQNPWYC